MFKKILAVFSAIILILLCGCGDASKENNTSKEKNENASKTSSEVVITKKQRDNAYTVTLDAKSGKDYVWKGFVGDEAVIKIEDATKEQGKDDLYSFSVIGLKEGSTTVTFTYKRETDVDVYLVARYELKVDKKFKVTEVSHEGTYFVNF